MNQEFYAIFHKPTGKYMPARMFGHSRGGWTWWEPAGVGGYGGHDPEIPRLFLKRNAAAQAMGYWLNGNYSLRAVPSDFDDPPRTLRVESPHIPRNPKDVEIHVITCVVTRVI
jgi:hypothetical protein